MQPTITQHGTIDNTGAVQPLDFTLSGIPIIDPGITPPPFIAAMPPAVTSAPTAAPLAGTDQIASAAGTTASQTFAPIVIHPIFGADIANRTSSTADPTTAIQIENAVTAAINYIETEFASNIPAIINNGTITNGVTINIAFDHGTLNGQPLNSGSGASRSQSNAYLFTWPQIKSLLASAPAVDPTGGGFFYLPFAEMKALGFAGGSTIAATSAEVDGYIALNTISNGATLDYNLNDLTIPGEINAVGAIEHEITEVFGRLSILGLQSAATNPIYTLMDLYRYSAPGVPTLNAGASDYFSLNGGTTDLATYNNAANGGDAGDWAASVTNDAFDASLIMGSPDTISAVDSSVLGVIGLQPLIAPVTIRGTAAKQAATDTGSPRPFSTLVVTDPNPGQTDTVTLTLSSTANGVLTNLGPGGYNAATGVWTDTASAVSITAALNVLVFTPNAHQVAPGQTVTTTFTIVDTDTAGVSATDSTTSVIATAIGVPPAITGTTAGQATTDQEPITPFPRAAVADVNAGQTETASVTLSAAANGTLTNLGGGGYSAATGVWSETGPVATVTMALDGLVFVPTAQQFTAGQTVITTFTVGVADTSGLSATNNTASVTTVETSPNATGLLDGLNVSQQLQLIYVAYFNRAADGPGFAFWGGQSQQARSAGQSAAVALTNVANAFTPQPETIALYPFLGTANVNLNTPAAQSGLGGFINSVYGNLFGHTPDAAGKNYWVGQVTSGAVGTGAAALAIANGATGADAIELLNKIAVAYDFTTKTAAAGAGATSPLLVSFVTAAQTAMSGVDGASLNDASVTAAMNATAAWLSGSTAGVGGIGTAGTAVVDANVITVTGQDQLIDPGSGSHTIRFLPTASGDTLVPHADGVDQVSGFDPGTDFLDLRALLVAANINPDTAALGNYLTVTDVGTDAVIQFDATGQSGGAPVAVLWGLGAAVTGLSTLIADKTIT